jgi:hypothetical protein
LKKKGWEFESKYEKENGGLNFYYYATKIPYKKMQYFIPELNKTITRYE